MYMVHKSDTSNPKPKLPPTKKPPAKKQKAQYKILFLTTYDSILTTNPSSVSSTLAEYNSKNVKLDKEILTIFKEKKQIIKYIIWY